MVAGGVAAVLYGVVRFTADLDIFVELSPANIDKLFSALDELGYKTRLPVTKDEFKDPKKRREWMLEKNMKVFSFFHPRDPFKTVDVLIDEFIPYKHLTKRVFQAGAIRVPAISLKDLKKLKVRAARPKDWADIHSLEEIERIQKKKS